MGDKKTNRLRFNWSATANIPYDPNVARSGVTTGAMASTNTIYSNVIDITNFDILGFDVTWTGTPTGTLSVMASVGGDNFYALTFDPALAQPAGSAGGYLINVATIGLKYLMLQYTNATGSGTLISNLMEKDTN